MRARHFGLLSILLATFVALFACGSKPTHTGVQEVPIASGTPSASTSASTVASAEPSAVPTDNAPPITWKPFLYRIAGTKPSYLFGTIHLPDSRLDRSPPAMVKILWSSDEVVTELPLDDTSPAHAMSLMQMPGNKKLADVLPAPLYARLKAVFVEKGIGMAFPMLERMKPWAIAIQVSLIDHMMELVGGSAKPIDIVLHDRAIASGKHTSGLETEAEQLGVFDNLSKEEQIRTLEQTLDQRDKDKKEGKDPIAVLMTLYLAGEEAPMLTALNAEFDPKRPLDVKLMKRLVTDRNVIMTDRITTKIKAAPNQSFFVAVGSAHLLGDTGIVALMKKKGFTVERVDTSAP